MNDDPAASAILKLLWANGRSTVAKISRTLGLSKDIVIYELRQLEAAGKVRRDKNGWQLTPVKRTVGKNRRQSRGHIVYGPPPKVAGKIGLHKRGRRLTKFQKDVMNALIRMAGPGAHIETHGNETVISRAVPPPAPRPSELLDLKMPTEMVQ